MTNLKTESYENTDFDDGGAVGDADGSTAAGAAQDVAGGANESEFQLSEFRLKEVKNNDASELWGCGASRVLVVLF